MVEENVTDAAVPPAPPVNAPMLPPDAVPPAPPVDAAYEPDVIAAPPTPPPPPFATMLTVIYPPVFVMVVLPPATPARPAIALGVAVAFYADARNGA